MSYSTVQIVLRNTTPRGAALIVQGDNNATAMHSHYCVTALFSIILMYLLFMPNAHAESVNRPEIAGLPNTGYSISVLPKTSTRPKVTNVLRVRGICHKGVAVFSVKNGAKKWAARGQLRIINAKTGQVVRERWMRLGAGQRATFRIPAYLVPSHRYRVMVILPGGSMTHLKSFRGRCPQPFGDVRAVRR